MKVVIKNNTVKIEPPEKTLKITGTRLATIFGMNNFSTPFQAWAEIVKVYKKPFEETKYTKAGKVLEPKQAEFVKNKYNLKGLVSPTDVFGQNYMSKTYGDFYTNTEIFGGMWDYLVNKPDGSLGSVLEMKTTQFKKKVEWDTALPSNYVLQAGLYAYLSNTDKFVIVATYLNPEQYDEPEKVELNDFNTFIYPKKLSEIPDFKANYIEPAIEWWNKYVVTGISPKYDPNNKDDMTIVEAIKKQYPQTSFKLNELDTDGYFF